MLQDPILFSNIKAINVEEVLNIRPMNKKSPATSPAKNNKATANTSNSAANIKIKGNAGLVPCKYGASCYQKNPMHFNQYSHPHLNNNANTNVKEEEIIPDADVSQEESSSNMDENDNNNNTNEDKMQVEEDNNDDDMNDSNLQPCKYGANCYRQNPEHFKEFSHPLKPGSQPKPALLPTKANTIATVKQAAPSKKSAVIPTNNRSDDENGSDNEDEKIIQKKSTQKKTQTTATTKQKQVVDDKKKTVAHINTTNTKCSNDASVTKSSISNKSTESSQGKNWVRNCKQILIFLISKTTSVARLGSDVAE